MSYEGPFELSVSRRAESINFSALPSEIQDALTGGGAFNPGQYDLFQFFVMPEFYMASHSEKGLSRKAKKKSWSKVDSLKVQMRPGAPVIRLLGIFPTSLSAEGRRLELEAEPLFEIGIPRIARLQIRGRLKNTYRKRRHQVLAARTDDMAQWLFFRSYFNSGADFRLKFLCALPADLSYGQRFVSCCASAEQGGRRIKSLKARKIELPATNSDSAVPREKMRVQSQGATAPRSQTQGPGSA